MNGVRAKTDENVERLLRRFKRTCEGAGVLAELKKGRSYEKPSEKKRRERKAAIRKGTRDTRSPRSTKESRKKFKPV